MTLRELKNEFFDTLITLYPKDEIENFYFLLLEEKLQLKRVDIALNPSKTLSNSELLYFTSSLNKLLKETPIQYIIGHTEFYGIPFQLSKDTLIPRPETEELIAWILSDLKPSEPYAILDIGTGSGCIAISLAKNLPKAQVTAYDISENALQTAIQNAKNNKVHIKFKNIDILKCDQLETQYDIIVSNPPYVRELEKKEIKNNVLQYEPSTALFVTNDNPLVFYEKIASLAKQNLKPGGKLYFEINQYLGKETVELIENKGYSNVVLKKDIFHNDRMIQASPIKI